MVPFEEWDTVDEAQENIAGMISIPAKWKAHWKEDKIWRGLAEPRKTVMERAIQKGKPTLCFIGHGQLGNRSDYVEEATDLGWQVIDNPNPLLTLVIQNPDRIKTKRALLAEELNLPIISFHEWDHLAYDFTEAVLEAIDSCRPQAAPDLNNFIAA